ncbi:hypothetical protein FJ930_29620 [Mesorhizobium sp. B2-4-15]|uniref:hypothetical protein n=1 Tax=Mesorhizobium sp. B2-4-15 TaxID=2589934 RepID=UPI0011518F17|nr:hypothetical protein [Mesorhizobium sp. B2-4-15]TPK58745.1 hypothetical protein FJ930_29620 [Mesorhizobium sp. B2-4-15]
MNQQRLPFRYKALIAVNLAVSAAGILLRSLYPKSIFIAMFIMATMLTALSGWVILREKLKPSTSISETRLTFTAFGVGIGLGIWGMYITLGTILE